MRTLNVKTKIGPIAKKNMIICYAMTKTNKAICLFVCLLLQISIESISRHPGPVITP